MVKPWHVWALDQHRTGKASETPKYLPMEVVVARFGDVGYVGMPFEPFVRTGLKIKHEAPLPCVLTSGIMTGAWVIYLMLQPVMTGSIWPEISATGEHDLHSKLRELM
jgi:hypothetical protein